MGKTYRRNAGFRPKKGRAFKDLKNSKKFKDRIYFDQYDNDGKKPPIEEIPPIVLEEDLEE